MKKLTALILALCMVFALCACGSGDTQPAAQNTPSAAQETQPAAQDPQPAAEIDWPTKTIEIICPYSAGGGSDTMARSLATALDQTGLLGQSVIVTNMPGGNGLIGASYVADKPDDQYLFVTNVTGDLGAWISSDSGMNMEYFKPVAMFCWDSYVMVVKVDAPYDSLEEMIQYSKDHPGDVTIAGTGIGTVDHILHLQCVSEYGMDAEYVAYDGGSDVVTAILGGHVSGNWCNPAEAIGYLESGDFKALAIAGDQRLESMSEVPSTAELGFEKINWRQYRGVLATKNTPDEVIEKFISVMEEACTSDYFLDEYIAAKSLIPDFRAGADFAATIEESWAEQLKVLGK